MNTPVGTYFSSTTIYIISILLSITSLSLYAPATAASASSPTHEQLQAAITILRYAAQYSESYNNLLAYVMQKGNLHTVQGKLTLLQASVHAFTTLSENDAVELPIEIRNAYALVQQALYNTASFKDTTTHRYPRHNAPFNNTPYPPVFNPQDWVSSLGGIINGTFQINGSLDLVNGSSIVLEDQTPAHNSITITAPPAVTTSYTLQMPSAQGAANTVLAQSAIPGQLVWATGSAGGGVTVVNGAPPITITGPATTPTVGITTASAVTNGALTSTDWNTFNNKVSSVAVNPPLTTTGGSTPTISIPQATTGTNGYLSASDWNTFNNKLNLTGGTMSGNITFSAGTGTVYNGSSGSVTVMAPNSAITSYTLLLPNTQGAVNAVLAQSNTPGTLTWANIGGLGGVTAVTASPPLASSGGSTPNITITQATTSSNGYLSSTDWNTFNNKVNRSGDSMFGTLTMLTQNLVSFQDAASHTVSLHAPASIPTSYTLALPSTIPTANQVLRANGITPTNLEWLTLGTSVTPAASKTIYVTKYGNDITGDGSQNAPYASLAKAISVANTLASTANPITISIATGIYFENNIAGPLTITAGGISIVGASITGTILSPIAVANNFLLSNQAIELSDFTIAVLSGTSTATGITLNTPSGNSALLSLQIANFKIGVNLIGGASSTYVLNNCFLITNTNTAIMANSASVTITTCAVRGTGAGSIGISATGTATSMSCIGGLYLTCQPAILLTGGAALSVVSGNFLTNLTGVVANAATQLLLESCSFSRANLLQAPVVDISVSDPGTLAKISSCIFAASQFLPGSNSTAVHVSNSAIAIVSDGQIDNYTNALIAGVPSDTNATELSASGVLIAGGINDLIQNGSSSLVFTTGTLASNKVAINDPTNVTLAFFDLSSNNSLNIGTSADIDTNLIDVAIGSSTNPNIQYISSLYSTQAMGFCNPLANPTTWFAITRNTIALDAITTDRTKTATLTLLSDTGSPVGSTSAIRGWNIQKNGTSAELAFSFQNSDTFALPPLSEYTIFQLDGFNNQIQFPSTATQLLFAGDTTLYRSSANILKTDGTMIIGGLTPGRIVITSPGNQLTSSTTTVSELGFLAGVTAPVQAQLNSKVSKSGDTMTGTLQVPAGTAALPGLAVGAANVGLSSAANNLSFDTNGTSQMAISSAGTVSIAGFVIAGIVHNDNTGNLSSSLITNADISNVANIADSKLATITSANKVANSATTATDANVGNTIVSRDVNGDFAARDITATTFIGLLTGHASLDVLKSGDIMTGTLQLPAGTTAVPALQFTGSTSTGISAPSSNTLSFDINGSEAVNIGNTGAVTITGLNTVGVVHTNASGTLSTSPVVNADIANATITNAKLAAISSLNTPNTIVLRDNSGNFTTNMITIAGMVTNTTDVATKGYVDSAISTGISAKTPAVVVSTSNIALSGTQTIDGVTLNVNDRVLLVAQSSPVQNGLWLVQVGAWTRPADFASGTVAGQAYVLITSGTVNAGSSWLCNTPSAIIDTDPIGFAEFSLPSQTTGANVGTGSGQIFRNTTGVTLNFKTLAAGTHIVVTNNTNDVTLSTDATSSNTPSTIVSRDAGGSFAANTITASLNGIASGNLPLTGGSLSGALTMLLQSPINFQDSVSNTIGVRAPTNVTSSYTLNLPPTAPLANQILRANTITPANLEWFTQGDSVPPSASKTIYVTQYGNDITGDGSPNTPYASLAKAISVANALASLANPITILISTGIYVEDNSTGPLAITASGISIIGDATTGVFLFPTTLSNDFISSSKAIQISNLTFSALNGSSTATGLVCSGSNTSSLFTNIEVVGFQVGINFGGTGCSYTLDGCFLVDSSGTAMIVSNAITTINNCYITTSSVGIAATGSATSMFLTGGLYAQCGLAIALTNNARVSVVSGNFNFNNQSVTVNSSAKLLLEGCSFSLANDLLSPVVDITVSDAGTLAKISSCIFAADPLLPGSDSTAVKVINSATAIISDGQVNNYTNALVAGTSTDTNATQLNASGMFITGGINDLIQNGATTLNFNTGTLASSKVSINDPTNVTLAFFDSDSNNSLKIGKFSDTNTELLEVSINSGSNPNIQYLSSLYSTQAMGLENPLNNSSTWFSIAIQNSAMTAITTDRTKIAMVRLLSDTGIPVGGTTALRGWDIQKNSTTAELAFRYQNSDTTGQPSITAYTVMQLDGVNNQLQLPNAATQMVFGSDTNLYRSAANILKTDDNMIIGGLTANRAIATDVNKQLTSSVTTDIELGYLSGTTSSVQLQLNSKVAKAGDVMTGTLQVPAGTAALPGLAVGAANTGLSSTGGNLTFSTNGTSQVTISTSGVVTIGGLTPAGVVHNDSFGIITTSLITNSDISATAAISDSKLATIVTAGKVANSATTATSVSVGNAIVSRDPSGNFSAGNVTHSTNTGDVYNGSSGAVTIQAPNSAITSYTLLLPTAQGTANQVLAQSGTPGTLTWASIGSLGGVTSVTATAPLASSGGTTPNLTITQATTSTNGFLSSTDWNTFNNKVTSVSATAPITSTGGTTPTIAIPQSNGTTNGFLSSTDWTTFNNKLNTSGGTMTGNITHSANTGDVYNGSSGAVTIQAPNSAITSYTLLLPTAQGTANQVLAQSGTPGTLTWASIGSLGGVTSVTATAPLASSGGTTPNLTITQATTSTNGFLSSTDWNTFNNKVTSVSATAPITSTGGTTPTIAIPQSNGTTNGFLSSTDWTTFNNKLNTSGGTMTGNITHSANTGDVYNGSSGAVTIQAPNSAITSYTLLLPTAQGTANQVLAQSGTPGTLTWASIGSLGGVTSVTATAPLASSGGTTPNLTITQATTSTNGFLSSTDWNTFNNKLNTSGGTMTGNITHSANTGDIYNGSSGAVTIQAPNSAITSYSLLLPTAQGTANQVLAQSGTPGTLTWASIGSLGGVTSVTATAPLASSGGTTPNLTITQATTSTNGFLSSTDWTTFNNKLNTSGGTMTGNITHSANTGDIYNGSSGAVTIQAPNSAITSYTLLLPTAQGTANQVLAQSGTPGTLTWASIGSLGGVTSVTATAPLASSGGTTPNLTITQATTSTNGFLSSTDWNTFNNKLNTSGGTMTGNITHSANTGDVYNGSSGAVTIQAPNSAITSYTLLLPTAQGTANQVLAQSGTPGTLTWASIGSLGGVTSVTATAPLASSGGTTPNLTITQATTSTNGFLSSTDWNTFNNKVTNGGDAVAVMVGTTNNQNLSLISNGVTRVIVDGILGEVSIAGVSSLPALVIGPCSSSASVQISIGAGGNAIAVGGVAGSGTAAAPAIVSTSDNTTGLYYPSSGQWAFSAGGTTTLQSDSTKSVSYATKYRALVHNNATQTPITANTDTQVSFQVKDFDPNSNMSAAGVYTVPVTGIYLINSCINLTAASGCTASLFVSINTLANKQNQYTVTGSIQGGTQNKLSLVLASIISLTAGQTVLIGINTTANSTIPAPPPNSNFSMHLLSI